MPEGPQGQKRGLMPPAVNLVVAARQQDLEASDRQHEFGPVASTVNPPL
jgi:hypothetical protein